MVIPSNYKYVLVMGLTIVGSLLVYKSCTTDIPNISGLGIKVPIIGGPAKPTVHNNTTTTVVSKPDGTTTTVIVDKTVTNKPRSLRLDLGVSVPYNDVKGAQTYDLGLSYRIMDHLWVGGAIYSDKKIGLRIGVEL